MHTKNLPSADSFHSDHQSTEEKKKTNRKKKHFFNSVAGLISQEQESYPEKELMQYISSLSKMDRGSTAWAI
jgi:hypothetical protein